MHKIKIENMLKKRRVFNGFTQKYMSELLNITQPQYSRVENALTDPTKYLNRLADIFGCAPKEVFSDENLKGIEENYPNQQRKVQRIEFKGSKFDSVYLEIQGWFSKKDVKQLMLTIDDGFENIRHEKEEQESADFKYHVNRATKFQSIEQWKEEYS